MNVKKNSALTIVSYYGLDREPISTACQHLRNNACYQWNLLDCPLYKWRGDVNEKRPDYLEAAVEIFSSSDVVLFWYHGLTVVEMRYLRTHTPAHVKFALFNWDDPFDWYSPFLNMKEMQYFFQDGGVLTCCTDAKGIEYDVDTHHLLPGYIEKIAFDVCEKYQGEDRFTCDVSFMCTNLYQDDRVYDKQKIPRKALLDAIYAEKDIVFHIYGPESLQSVYPEAYQGYLAFEDTYTVMRTSRICLSTHVVSKGVENYANERTVIAMGCGALLVTDVVPAQSKALPLGSSVTEALLAIKRALEMPYQEAENIRVSLREHAKSLYTWKHWADTMSHFLTCRHLNDSTKHVGGEVLVVPSKENQTIQDLNIQRNVVLDRSDPWEFDVAVSIGTWCIGAHHLRARGLRKEAYPFDWTFSNLPAVIESVPEQNALLVVNEFLTPDGNRTVFPSENQQQLGFPHHNPHTLDGILYMRRACERWRRLLHIHNVTVKNDAMVKKSVLFIHTPRPHERVTVVRHDLERFIAALKTHSPHLNAHVISVWHQVWDPTDEKETYLNGLQCVERTQDVTILLAHVSSEWDADNWAGTQHYELWDQVFETFKVVVKG